MKKRALLLTLLLALLLLAGCMAGPNPTAGSPGGDEQPAGFWLGLWHGFIVLFSFIFSLFNDSVSLYEVHNSGGWYNLGFLLGISAFFGGSGRGSAARRR